MPPYKPRSFQQGPRTILDKSPAIDPMVPNHPQKGGPGTHLPTEASAQGARTVRSFRAALARAPEFPV